MCARHLWFVGLLGALAFAALYGCAAPNEAHAQQTMPVSNDAMIKQIENEPGMPEEQKQAALARLKGKPPVPKFYAH